MRIPGWTAALLYLASFALPVFRDEDSPRGWQVAWMAVSGSVVRTWEILYDRPGGRIEFDCVTVLWYLGTLANALFVAVGILLRKLRNMPAILVLCLMGAVLTALSTPIQWSTIELSFFRTGPSPGVDLGKVREHVSQLNIGYWCWMGSMLIGLLASVFHWRNLRRSGTDDPAAERGA